MMSGAFHQQVMGPGRPYGLATAAFEFTDRLERRAQQALAARGTTDVTRATPRDAGFGAARCTGSGSATHHTSTTQPPAVFSYMVTIYSDGSVLAATD